MSVEHYAAKKEAVEWQERVQAPREGSAAAEAMAVAAARVSVVLASTGMGLAPAPRADCSAAAQERAKGAGTEAVTEVREQMPMANAKVLMQGMGSQGLAKTNARTL